MPYPHDVLASAVLALPVAYLTSLALRRWATPLVASLSSGALRPVLTAEPATVSGAEPAAEPAAVIQTAG
ncbi:hypothetical protein [Actinacidiphila paucisporea]|uniref:Uncharacterized protein n=1 Tax=Actinacidiphila paucisporea TaxID=310782 RepID=A0A1M7MN70_9ACTN|nr:hypothetical protein [Actinacidiphila paucisporea]SHM92450.1 hypothetical protein SAMN05216499_116115 [Actinacidiphila paucisporea]